MLSSTLTAPTVAGLTPYAGTFGRAEAGHLLRRTLFGPTLAEIDRAVNRGLSATLDELFTTRPLPPPPLNHFFEDDPNVPIGETWVDSPFLENADVGKYRWPSLRGWYFNNLFDSTTSIREKMTMFWFNHFGMADVGDHRAQYQYVQLFRRLATGNFRTLIEQITVHPAMLQFLNGRYNNKNAPDENYARELLELFTVQKGQPGDVNYTEDDIREIARVLTGWRVDNFWSNENAPITAYFDAGRHDEGTKQLSSKFGNAVIKNEGAEEYKTLIGVVFDHPETSKAICRDLYLYFVGDEIDDNVEAAVISPLAQLLRESDFELEPVLRNLFASDRFLRPIARGTIVKNPYEFMLSMARPLGGYDHLELDLNLRYNLGNAYHWWAGTMDMDFLYLPSVSGWKAYYQAPDYYRKWINSTTLQRRREFVENVCGNGVWTEGAGRPFDWFAFLASLSKPEDINALIDDVAAVFLAVPPHPDQVTGLKEVLLPGLPDFEWTVQYRQYLASPDNAEIVNSLSRKVRDFFRAFFSTAEFHLQ